MVRIIVVASALALAVSLLVASEAGAQQDDGEAPPFTPSWAAPQLEVSPRDGRPGEIVSITGGDFSEDVRVYYGPTPMRILDTRDDRIEAEIPPDAIDDHFIYAVDETGRARTENRFALAPRDRRYDPRYDPRDRRDEPRYDPRDRRDDPRYDPRDRRDEPRYDPRDRRDDPRYDPRDRRDDPRYDPRDRRDDPRYDPRDRRYDPRYDGPRDPRYERRWFGPSDRRAPPRCDRHDDEAALPGS